jgi:hypothetical protein
MVGNLRGKKVWTHQDDEVRYVFTPMEQNYNSNFLDKLWRGRESLGKQN